MSWASRFAATRTFKALLALLVLLIVVVVLAAIFGEDTSEPEPAQQPATRDTVRVISTTTPTTTVLPTDTKLPPIEHPPPPPRTTRSAPPPSPPAATGGGSPQDCAARADVVALFIDGVLELADLFELQILVGDLAGAQESYDTIDWVMADWGEISADLQRDCQGLNPSAAAQARSGMEDMSAAWREVQGYCRAELAPVGFYC